MKPYIEALSGRGPSSIETYILAPPANHDDLGSLFLLADLTDLAEAFRYLAPTIAGAVQREYYSSEGGQNPQHRFTQALRAANQELAKEATTSTAQWMGSLKAIVGLIAERQILVSHTGGCIAFILRKGTATEIPLEAGEGSRPFGSITTGLLEHEDEILIAPRTILGVADVPKELSTNPKRFLGAIRKTEGAGCLHIITEERRLRSTASVRGLLPFALHIPRLRLRLPFAKGIVRSSLTTFALQKLSHIPLPLNPIRRLRQNATLRKLPLWQLSPRRSFLLIPVALAVLGILFFLTTHSGKNTARMNTAAALQAAQEALEQSETQLILNNKTEAIAIVTEALDRLKNNQSAGAEIQKLREELTARRRELAGITATELETVLQFNGFPLALDPQRIAMAHAMTPNADNAPSLAVSGSDHAAVWTNDSLSETEGTFLFLPPPLQSHINDTAAASEILRFIVVTPEGFAAIDPQKRTVTNVLARANGNGTILSSFTNGALTVLPDEKSIRLFAVDDGDSLTERAWAKGRNEELSQARDATTLENKDLLVLLSNNTFLRYRNGSRVGLYHIEGFGWDGEARAFVALPDGRLAVLDGKNGRVLLTNDKGDIQVQLEHSSLINARDIVASPDGTSVLVLTSETLLRLALPEKSATE